MPENNKATPVIIKKESVSDDAYIVTGIFFNNGDAVSENDVIAEIEGSKATIGIESPKDGYVFYNYALQDNIKVGEVLALISKEKKINKEDFLSFSGKKDVAEEKPGDTIQDPGIRLSKSAEKLMAKHNISPSVFAGKKIVRAKDVEEYLKGTRQSAPEHKEAPVSPEANNQIVIVGGGGHAGMCIDIIKMSHQYTIAGIVDDAYHEGDVLHGYKVLGKLDALPKLYNQGIRHAAQCIGAVLNPHLREKTYKHLKQIGFVVPNLIHPKAIIEPSAAMGEGNQLMAGALVGSNVQIENNCIINSGANVCHDSIIKDHVHIAPGAIIAGGVTIGQNTLIGMGVTVFLGLEVGKNVVINNGLTINKNISDNTMVKS